MKIQKLIFLFLLIPLSFYGQKKTIEIFGKITGESKAKIYLFFENDLAHGDSLSSKIKNGKFYFKVNAVLPILCRIHFLENSQIQEFYIDNSKTDIKLSSKLTEKNIPDSLGGPKTLFDITNIEGSTTENVIRSFKNWKSKLEKSKKSVEQKHVLYYDKLKSIVIKYPKSRASAYLIAGGIYFRGNSFSVGDDLPLNYSETSELMSILDTSLLTTMEWANLSNLLTKMDFRRNRVIGNLFNDVVLKDTSENSIDTKFYRNKFVLIDFWASWCKPCRALNPELKILYEDYKDKGFEIIGISIDSEKKDWKKAIIQDNLKWPQLHEGVNGALSKYYDIEYIPTKVLLDKNGLVIGFNLSPKEIDNILKTRL